MFNVILKMDIVIKSINNFRCRILFYALHTFENMQVFIICLPKFLSFRLVFYFVSCPEASASSNADILYKIPLLHSITTSFIATAWDKLSSQPIVFIISSGCIISSVGVSVPVSFAISVLTYDGQSEVTFTP